MTTFCSVLAAAADAHPERPLFIFPETRWRGAEQHSYGSLASAAAAAARELARFAAPGDRVLLIFPSGTAFWEAFFGCLARGIIGVPLNVPNLNRTSEQLERVCEDCRPAVIAADQDIADLLEKRKDRHHYFDGIPVVTPDQWRGESEPFSFVAPGRGTPAFLQYTSGSTSRPKGVQISHVNLLTNAELIRDRMELRVGEDRGVTWLPHYHDMGLVGSYLETLFSRNTTWCLPPEEFALRPSRWLELISEHRASICGGPNFAYQMCVDRIPEGQPEGLDLSSWRVAYIGAERIRPETLAGFFRRFGPHGFSERSFFPCYGLGEATLMVTGGPASATPVIREVSSAGMFGHRIEPARNAADTVRFCGSGQTFAGSGVLIRDSETGELLPEDGIGEIVVAGASVTEGYYARPELNADLFCELEYDGKRRQFLRTGDLGFFSNGELFITGRTRELMIVRGRNLYPDDVESRVSSAHEALLPGGAVAFSADIADEESLIVAAELQRSAIKLESGDDVFACVRRSVVEAFGVNPAEILLLRPASVPRTSSGKPRRLIVRENYIAGTITCLFRELSSEY